MLTNRTTCRVIYGDTDRMGHAYYANYLRWFEVGRAELFRSLGLTYRELEETGVFLPVSESFCRYLNPIKYDEVLVIEATLDTTVKSAMKFDYRLFKDGGRTPVAEGYTKHPCVNGDGKVVRPPRFLRDFIQKKMDEAGG